MKVGCEKTNRARPNDDNMAVEQRLAMLSRKLERLRESREKKDREWDEWVAEIEREMEELKSSLAS